MTSPVPPVRPGGTAPLGGHTVARVGYGAMQLAERPSGPVATDDAVALLRHAVARGVDHVDTAEFYGHGDANAAIRAALHPYPDGLVLVSKVGANRAPDGALVVAQKPAELRASVEANLRTLGAERVDVVNLRRVDTPPGLVATGDQVVDLDDQLAEMVALRDEGKIGAIGLSSVGPDQLRRALPVGVVCVQNAYNVLDRAGEPMLELCREHGIAWVPFFPLGSAFAHTPSVTDQAAVIEAAAELGVTPSQVGLAWLLGHAPNVLLIPGTASIGHLEENLGAGEVVLDPATTAALDAVAGPRRELRVFDQ